MATLKDFCVVLNTEELCQLFHWVIGLPRNTSDYDFVCSLLLLGASCVCVCMIVQLSLSGQVWRQSGRVGLLIEEAIEKGASH